MRSDKGNSSPADTQGAGESLADDGWLLLRLPGREALPVDVDLLDRMGLEPEALADGGFHLTMADTTLELASVDRSSALTTALLSAAGDSLQVIGSAERVSENADGRCLALRLVRAPNGRAAGAQRLCAAAALMGDMLGADYLYWSPAALWSPLAMLADAVQAMERQGLPPVLHLVAFQSGTDDARLASLSSRGLYWLAGQELRLNYPSSYSVTDVLRRAARLAIDAMLHDGVGGPMIVDGLERGETLAIGAAEIGRGVPVIPVELRRAMR